MHALHYCHVDVFGDRPYRGNSLAVVFDAAQLSNSQRQQITQELRHFETVFLEPLDSPQVLRAHICDQFEELDFAGHPLLGAACALHQASSKRMPQQWRFVLNRKEVSISTAIQGSGFYAQMNQGAPEFIGLVAQTHWAPLCAALQVSQESLHPQLPIEVVSLGLPYVIVPLRHGLEKARLTHENFEAFLRQFGAQFAYVFDVEKREGRTWNNDGILEDVATGSAAGAVAAYLTKHGRLHCGERAILNQGRFAGRPSQMEVETEGTAQAITNVVVAGRVFVIGRGTLEVLP